MYILENGQVLASGSAHEIKNKYAPSKLVIKLNENQQLTTAYPVIAKDKHIELNGLDKDEAITLLHQNQAKIKSFEYRQGSIDDAFINIAGKELQ